MRESEPSLKRLRLLQLGFAAVALLIAGQLFRIQVLSHSFYAALASGQHDLFKRLFPERGKVYSKDPSTGQLYVLATNQKLSLVYAEPSRLKDPKAAAAKLAPLLGLDEGELAARVSNPRDVYKPLKHQVDDELKAQIQALKLDGIGFAEEDFRFYPEKDSGAQVIGFVGVSDSGRSGRYGIEGYFDKELAGTSGFLESEKDSFGRLITVGDKQLRPAQDGDDFVLTIDRTVEYRACGMLDKWVADHGAERGALVILDPKTGAVVAMCDSPSFDPNAYNKVDDVKVFNNTAIFDAYEPGSVFKTVTMAAALDEGKITPDTSFNDTGSVKIGPNIIKNALPEARGLVSMTDVLAFSLNTGIIDVVSRIGSESFRKYVRDFGFGEKTGVELQTESSGNVSSLEKKGDIWSATGAFGQGLTVTPLQLAAAYGAIADGGILMKPRIVSETRRADGRVDESVPKMIRRVISERAAKLLSGMLVAVVERGEGKKAAVPGYWVAGKTGTAQIPRTDGPGYEKDATIGSFAGFGPIEDPKFAMVVRIDRPKDVQFAESSAAPLWGQVAKMLMDYYAVPPTRH